MVEEADGDYHCEFFVLSKKEEPIDFSNYLNVAGSYVYDRHDGKCFLSTPFSKNFFHNTGCVSMTSTSSSRTKPWIVFRNSRRKLQHI